MCTSTAMPLGSPFRVNFPARHGISSTARSLSPGAAHGFVLNNCADAYYSLGDLDQATDYYRQALELRHWLGHKRGEATSARSLGAALREAGDIANARAAWQQSLEVLEELGDSEAEQVRAELDRLARV